MCLCHSELSISGDTEDDLPKSLCVKVRDGPIGKGALFVRQELSTSTKNYTIKELHAINFLRKGTHLNFISILRFAIFPALAV